MEWTNCIGDGEKWFKEENTFGYKRLLWRWRWLSRPKKKVVPNFKVNECVWVRVSLFRFSIYLVSFNRSDEIMISLSRTIFVRKEKSHPFSTDGPTTKKKINRKDTLQTVVKSFSVWQEFTQFFFRILVSRHVTLHHYICFLAPFICGVEKFVHFYLTILYRVRCTNGYYIEFTPFWRILLQLLFIFFRTRFSQRNSWRVIAPQS